MFKYNIKNFNQFFNCIIRNQPIFVERLSEDFPIPETYGVIFNYENPDTKENNIIVCLLSDNTDMDYKIFEKMIINIELTPEAQVKIFTLKDSLSIYNGITIHSDVNMFVLDNLIERNITINN